MVEYENNAMKVKEAINDAVFQFMTEACGEIQDQTIKNSRTDTGQTKGSYKYKVVKEGSSTTGYVGSDLENAIWEEYGTGEYALKGNGRKGGWYIPAEKLNSTARSKMKKVVGKDGKIFYFTRGKKPNKPLFNAYAAKKAKIERRLSEVLKSK